LSTTVKKVIQEANGSREMPDEHQPAVWLLSLVSTNCLSLLGGQTSKVLQMKLRAAVLHANMPHSAPVLAICVLQSSAISLSLATQSADKPD
jgi:hypothetical protein